MGPEVDWCGSQLFFSLPDDILPIISASLLPRDLCNLSLCCRSLRTLAFSDVLWHIQCSITGLLSTSDLPKWRPFLSSYRALCRFLLSSRPLLGVWVHDNPNQGNFVFVMLGFLSLIACRVIPQKVGPSGLDGDPLLWSPVFEITAELDGSMAFFLHGSENNSDYLYPGFVNSIHPRCSLLRLEVEPRPRRRSCNLLRRPESAIRRCNSDSDLPSCNSSISPSCPAVPFSCLKYGDQIKLLLLVANQVRLKVPGSLSCSPFFPHQSSIDTEDIDLGLFAGRRAHLLQIHKLSGGAADWQLIPGLGFLMMPRKMKSVFNHLAGFDLFSDDVDGTCSSSKTMEESLHSHEHLQEFLGASERIALSFCALIGEWDYNSFPDWPMENSLQCALYKVRVPTPAFEQECAGLWSGSFGWPPGQPAEGEPAALLFVLITYQEYNWERALVATMLLDGSSRSQCYGGCELFVAKIDDPAFEPFPWDVDGIEIKNAYNGEGYGVNFFYDHYDFAFDNENEIGSLFVMENGLLAFVWKENREVLTLQRLDLHELLKKGKRVAGPPSINNFSYVPDADTENVFDPRSFFTWDLLYTAQVSFIPNETSHFTSVETPLHRIGPGSVLFSSDPRSSAFL